MKILQVQFKNRNGHTLRGIVTLPDTEGKVPFVVHLHGFAGSCSGYKSMYTHLSRALAAQGIGSARFDFYGNGESDGEFEDMSFDGLHTDAQDIFAWAAEQPYVDSEKLFLSGQSMGGYIAASCAPVIQPHGLILLCPGAGMWFGCAQRADGIMQTGKDYADMEGLCYKMAFNYEMAKHPDPFTEAKGYNGPVLLLFLLYILPVLADTYSAMGVRPTGTLALLLALKDGLLQQPLLAVLCAATLTGILLLMGRKLLRWFLRSRLSGNFHGLLLEVRFCRLLALLLESGVGITRAVAIVTDTIDDEQYAQHLRLLNSRLQRGIAIEQAAGGAKELFSALMLELVCVGASTGYLPQMLQEAVTAGEQRLQQQLGRLRELLVPLLLLVAAIIIAGIVCIVIGPLFEMLSAMPE